MVIKRKIQEYRDKIIRDEIKSKEAIIGKLKGDILRVQSEKGKYNSSRAYESDLKSLEKEISRLQKKVDSLKTKIEGL